MTICDILDRRTVDTPERLGYAFLTDRGRSIERLAYGTLRGRILSVAAFVRSATARQEPVACVVEPGLDFIAAFFGCLWAGRIAVPAAAPRPRQGTEALAAVVIHSGARVALTNAATLDRLRLEGIAQSLPGVAFVDIAGLPADASAPPESRADDLAFLQYTSGSTGAPKGVAIGHDNLLANSRQIAAAFGHDEASVGVIWLPPYHDMGLVGGIVQPLYAGFPVYLMSPTDMVRHPATWLEAISRYRGTTSGGPNFAFEMCVSRIPAGRRREFDLSSWKVAFCGAEPVSIDTLSRFADAYGPSGLRRSALMPCYGLAESTLMVTTAPRGAEPTVAVPRHPGPNGVPALEYVNCGRPSKDHRVVVVAADGQLPLEEGEIGEILVQGPSVARGYWRDEEATESAFGAKVAGVAGGFLRTGDLGFFKAGALHVCGRLRSLLVIRGTNHSPEDIERTTTLAHPALNGQLALAAGIRVAGEERLVIVVEAPPRARSGTEASELVNRVREEIVVRHGLAPFDVKLIPVGRLPRTRSGKLRRDIFADPGSGALERFLESTSAPGSAADADIRSAG